MAGLFKQRWFLFFVLAVFIICKIPHLFYPYYWDASWPYAPAIRAMYDHGISLMPNAIDAELSRGHPLFFHVIAAMWMHVFGLSHLAMHSFALFISVLLLITVYEVGLRLFDQRVAVISLLVIVTQVIFIVQSSFVLFEMLVALLAFLSLYCYVRDRYYLTILCLLALFLTKESGLVAGFVLGCDALAGLFNKKNDLKTRVLRFTSVAIPCVFMGIYFLIQKQERGWYIFPLYNEAIQHNWKHYWYNLRVGVLDNAFDITLRNWYFIALMILSLIAARMNKNIRYGAIFLTGLIIFCLVDDMRPGRIMPSVPFFIVFISSVCYLLHFFSSPAFFADVRQRRFIRLSGIFTLCFLCFCPLNFYIYRYLLAALVPLLFLSAVFFDLLINRLYKPLYYPLLAFILLIGFLGFKADGGFGDCDPGAFDAMDVQQSVVSYFEQNNCYDQQIGTGSFLEKEHLIDPATGYLHSNRIFKNVAWYINNHTDYAVFDNIEHDYRYNSIKEDSSFHRIFRYEKGKVWAEIYRRK